MLKQLAERWREAVERRAFDFRPERWLKVAVVGARSDAGRRSAALATGARPAQGGVLRFHPPRVGCPVQVGKAVEDGVSRQQLDWHVNPMRLPRQPHPDPRLNRHLEIGSDGPPSLFAAEAGKLRRLWARHEATGVVLERRPYPCRGVVPKAGFDLLTSKCSERDSHVFLLSFRAPTRRAIQIFAVSGVKAG